MRADRIAAAAAGLLGLANALAQESVPRPDRDEVVATAVNPNPRVLPSLSFCRRSWAGPAVKKWLPTVVSTFPGETELSFDSWCYESGWMEYLGARATGGGKLEIRHRVRDYPRITVVTTAAPRPGALELIARMELNGSEGALPEELRSPNVCFQMFRNAAFSSKPDAYSTFAERCFIFTAAGRTFLNRTRRRPSPLVPPGDIQNNPPWVQMYSATWRNSPENRANWSWPLPPLWIAAHSPDHYVTPVIGVVSRDGRYLAAVANGSADTMLQAFHDCLHNNPEWLPRGLPPAQRTWRMKIYVMKNDPDALLERVARDFPPPARSR